MQKKLLFVVNVDWFFISHRLPIALKALQEDYEVHLACGFSGEQDRLRDLGILVHELPIDRSGTSIFKEWLTLRAIYSSIRQIQPDLVHMVTIKPVVYGGIVARLLKVKAKVVSISGLGYLFIGHELKARLLRRVVSRLYRYALGGRNTKVIFQNPTDRDFFISLKIIRPEQAVIIRGSGVDLTKYKAAGHQFIPPVFALISRLIYDKGVGEFVDAARHLKRQEVNVRMVIVGSVDENPKSVSKKDIKKWVSEGVIEYWGYSNNVSETINKVDVVVLPSYREGLPKVLIEAAAGGKAVITTDVPGCRDAIDDRVSGLLVPPRDATALAKAIKQLADGPAEREHMGKQGRKLAEEAFDIQNVVQTHLDIYQLLVIRNEKTADK